MVVRSIFHRHHQNSAAFYIPFSTCHWCLLFTQWVVLYLLAFISGRSLSYLQRFRYALLTNHHSRDLLFFTLKHQFKFVWIRHSPSTWKVPLQRLDASSEKLIFVRTVVVVGKNCHLFEICSFHKNQMCLWNILHIRNLESRSFNQVEAF